MPRKITDLIVVCSSGRGLDTEDTTMLDLERDARERGYSGIRYHIVLDKAGGVMEGRHIDSVGAHTVDELGVLQGFPESNISVNGRSIGVCLIGSHEDPWTGMQLNSLACLLKELCNTYPDAIVAPDCAFNAYSPTMLDFTEWCESHDLPHL